MNIFGSLVESYMYADMFNREYDGGSSAHEEKIYVGGAPVEYILPTLHQNNFQSKNDMVSGGSRGSFQNKVVPAGLVIIYVHKDQDADYENMFYPGENREVIPDALYDRLTESVFKESGSKPRYSTPPKHNQPKNRSKKHKKRIVE
jgi:hypothetical protein